MLGLPGLRHTPACRVGPPLKSQAGISAFRRTSTARMAAQSRTSPCNRPSLRWSRMGRLRRRTSTTLWEFSYAFDKDETRGLLAGVQDTRIDVATVLARIHPNIIGYVGGYYQWPNNWK